MRKPSEPMFWICTWIIAGLLGAAYGLYSIEKPKPTTCENIGCIGCDCPKGYCKCSVGGTTCKACKHLRTPAEEEALRQQKLLDQAKRAK